MDFTYTINAEETFHNFVDRISSTVVSNGYFVSGINAWHSNPIDFPVWSLDPMSEGMNMDVDLSLTVGQLLVNTIRIPV